MARAITAPDPTADRQNIYLRCRTYGHAWDEFFPVGLPTPMFGWRLSLRCTRCTMERHDIIDSNGGVGSRSYDAPEGYERKGEGVWERAEGRQELFKKLKGQLSKSGSVGKKSTAA